MNKKPSLLGINWGFFSVIAVLALFLEGIESLPYVLVGLGLLYYIQLSSEEKRSLHSILSQNRKIWLKDLVHSGLPTGGQNRTNYFSNKVLDLDHFNRFFYQELGLNPKSHRKIYTSPDFQAAERELIKADDRTSILLGMTVFIPVLFALLHIFRFVGLSIFLIEMQVAFLLAWLVVVKQDQSYDTRNWNEFYNTFEEYQGHIMRLGKRSLNFLENLVDNPKAFELGIKPTYYQNLPSQESFGLIFSLVSNIPKSQRAGALDSILKDLENLPDQENILLERWGAYNSRTKMVTLASTAVSAMLAGVAQFTVPLLKSDLLPIQSTPYLIWGQFVVVIGINLIILSQWMELKQLGFWFGIYSLVYFSFFLLNSILLL